MPYCKLCNKEVDQLHYDIEQWILDTIRRQHPDWIAADGSCEPCIEYYGGMLDNPLPGPDN